MENSEKTVVIRETQVRIIEVAARLLKTEADMVVRVAKCASNAPLESRRLW